MIRTLLRQVHPQNRIPGLLRVAYLSQDDQDDLESMEEQSPSPPVFKYGRFIRRIVPQWYSPSGTFNFVHIDSLVMEYATTHQLFDQYVAEGVLSNNIHDDSKDKAFEDALKMDIHRQLIWILCQDHMDTIEELTIPLFDIERYIDHVGQFTSLSKVIFSDDNNTILWGYKEATHGNELDPDQNVATTKYNRYSTGMLQFVQQHTLIHKNVLRYVEADIYATPDLFFEIQALLPPLHKPRSIDRWNWIKFVARVMDTNLNHLESIGMYTRNELDDNTRWLRDKAYELLRSQPFLPRCRTLKELKMYTLGPDMFQWAVQEKKQMDEARQQEKISSLQVSTRQHGHHDNDLVPLVPLRSVTLDTKELRQPSVQELDDIAFAFSDTLEEITMRVGWSKGRNEYDSLASTPQVAYGQGWDLPHLRTLVLSVNHFQLYFDMDGLGQCRSLESIRLRDEITPYNHREVRSWSPVSLPHLRVLDLQGSPALHFNMDSLHHSPCLETLSLSMEAMYYSDLCYYIPSAEELEREDSDNQGTDSNDVSGMPGSNQGPGSIGRRPRYTWDWHLQNLSDLELAAVFAFQFDFQWLQYLPNLQRLRLDMRSSGLYDPTVSHKRRITLKDVTRGQQLHQQDEDESEVIISDQFISLPKLDTMHLFGQWNFKKKVVETFCSSVAPNLRHAEFGDGYAGITPQESIALVKRMPCLQYIYFGLPLTPEKMQGLGLPHWGEVPEQEKHCNKQLVFYLHDYGCHSFVVW